MVQKPEGFIARLVQKAIDNIQVTVEKVHIRYEDSRSEVPALTATPSQLSLILFPAPLCLRPYARQAFCIFDRLGLETCLPHNRAHACT